MCLIVTLVTYSARKKTATATQHFRTVQTLTLLHMCRTNLCCRIAYILQKH